MLGTMQCIFVQFYRKRKLSVKLMTTKTSLINDVTLYFHRAYLFVSQRNNMDNKVIYSANCVLYDTDLHTETRTIRGVHRGVLCSRCLKVFGFCTVGSAPFPLHRPPSIRELFSIRARPVTVTPQTSARSTHNIAQSMCARARANEVRIERRADGSILVSE